MSEVEFPIAPANQRLVMTALSSAFCARFRRKGLVLIFYQRHPNEEEIDFANIADMTGTFFERLFCLVQEKSVSAVANCTYAFHRINEEKILCISVREPSVSICSSSPPRWADCFGRADDSPFPPGSASGDATAFSSP